MKIQTFVINIERAEERRKYMFDLLGKYDFLDISLISAIDGRLLTNEEVFKFFDEEKSYMRYGRTLNRGEIGCTLSHISCYKRLLESTSKYALIFEDDISILRDITILQSLEFILDTDNPIVLLLSGDYWYTSKREIQLDVDIVSVYDAVGAYAYLINRSAAKIVLSKCSRPSHVADHWLFYRDLGIRILAVKPYLIDANIGGMESTIKQEYFGENRSEMSLGNVLRSFRGAAMKKMLLMLNHFVSKIRTI